MAATWLVADEAPPWAANGTGPFCICEHPFSIVLPVLCFSVPSCSQAKPPRPFSPDEGATKPRGGRPPLPGQTKEEALGEPPAHFLCLAFLLE